ncbi:hypothetical protein RHODO2019_08745 [Rhodococcus antarcticus]|uniref:Uncharacterized protein n=1 Tax=Rhodococcus antarcticus TaxID=2987751 RepID=A0ABY6P4N6_9NOCA|nr:hypothetical protein [Rhodococcus antarcticus]UZJ26464.1 hypothetical protein RHODO2019_08745 [Rhodococcus antarcticus]
MTVHIPRAGAGRRHTLVADLVADLAGYPTCSAHVGPAEAAGLGRADWACPSR